MEHPADNTNDNDRRLYEAEVDRNTAATEPPVRPAKLPCCGGPNGMHWAACSTLNFGAVR